MTNIDVLLCALPFGNLRQYIYIHYIAFYWPVYSTQVKRYFFLFNPHHQHDTEMCTKYAQIQKYKYRNIEIEQTKQSERQINALKDRMDVIKSQQYIILFWDRPWGNKKPESVMWDKSWVLFFSFDCFSMIHFSWLNFFH